MNKTWLTFANVKNIALCNMIGVSILYPVISHSETIAISDDLKISN